VDSLGTIFNQLLEPIFGLFKLEMFAPALAMIITLIGLFLVGIFALKFHKNNQQIKSLRSAIEPIATESDFASSYHLVEHKLDSKKIAALWGEYLETCIMPDLNDPRVLESDLKVFNTYRPQEYFSLYSIFPPNAITNSLPNLFVGGGLVDSKP
jgi:hypothetical protein